eukprot:TRINITY_DN1742_c1_g2_i2.p1 TRINITY_DN1742_c1_g2~~TRINITY_DN1742_c1_g2_i2.p1  ORF type:complete len:331 (+),score=72.38 TRINITY_DN1742_c1_g2_i2:321-1313(+)
MDPKQMTSLFPLSLAGIDGIDGIDGADVDVDISSDAVSDDVVVVGGGGVGGGDDDGMTVAWRASSSAVFPVTGTARGNDDDDDDDDNDDDESDGGDVVGNATSPVCCSCGARQSPAWRAGPAGPRTLCNKCGLAYFRNKKNKFFSGSCFHVHPKGKKPKAKKHHMETDLEIKRNTKIMMVQPNQRSFPPQANYQLPNNNFNNLNSPSKENALRIVNNLINRANSFCQTSQPIPPQYSSQCQPPYPTQNQSCSGFISPSFEISEQMRQKIILPLPFSTDKIFPHQNANLMNLCANESNSCSVRTLPSPFFEAKKENGSPFSFSFGSPYSNY